MTCTLILSPPTPEFIEQLAQAVVDGLLTEDEAATVLAENFVAEVIES